MIHPETIRTHTEDVPTGGPEAASRLDLDTELAAGVYRPSEFERRTESIFSKFRETGASLAELSIEAIRQEHLERPWVSTPEELAAERTVRERHFRGFRTDYQEMNDGHELERLWKPGTAQPEHVVIGLHGWMGGPENFGTLADSETLRQYTQIYPRRRGYGPEAPQLLTEQFDPAALITRHAEDCLELMHEVRRDGAESITLMGHSMGGMIKQEVERLLLTSRGADDRELLAMLRRGGGVSMNTSAETNVVRDSFLDLPKLPETVERLGRTAGPSVRPVSRLLSRMSELSDKIPAQTVTQVETPLLKFPARQVSKVLLATGYVMEQSAARRAGTGDDVVSRASRAAAKRHSMLNMMAEGLAMGAQPDRPEITELEVPNLILHGDRDRLIKDSALPKLMEQYGTDGAFFSVDTGHFTMVERPDETNRALDLFIRDPRGFVDAKRRLDRQRDHEFTLPSRNS